MEELATVTAVNNGEISVVSQIKSSCNSCSQVDTCASGQVAKAIPHKQLSFVLNKPKSLENQTIKIGDCVVLTLPEINLLQSAWQVYLLPIFGLFIFSAFGQWLKQEEILSHELFALAIGILGGYIGYRLAKYLQNHVSQQGKLEPKISRIIPKALHVDNSEHAKFLNKR